MWKKLQWNKVFLIVVTGALMGVLFVSQGESVDLARAELTRENRVNVFRELQILKDSERNLREELEALEREILDYSSRERALEKIREEIILMEILMGEHDLQGEGVVIEVSDTVEALWFVDLVNELYTAGAEMVAINGKLLHIGEAGFDNIPNGQVIMGGDILQAPYQIEAIGNAADMELALSQEGGIIERMQNFLPDHEIRLRKSNNIMLEGSDA